jgi:WD40 repeat protein
MAKAGNQIFTVSSTSNTSFQVNLASFTVSGSPISSNSSANINAGIGTRIKVDPTNTYIVVWNQKGAYFVRNVANMAVSVMDRFQFLTTSTINNVDFSPDGSRMVIEFDNMANLTVIETTGFTTLATVSVPAIIKKVEFLNNTIIVLFHESYVSYYDSDTLSLVAQSSAPSTSEHIKADFLKHKVYECATGLIKIHKFRCPPLQYFKAGGFLECVPVTPVADCLAYN